MPPLYSSRIIKAGALLADTKTLLAHWDTELSSSTNLSNFRHDNIFGKASRSRIEDILAIFRQRYLSEEPVIKALVTMVRANMQAVVLERILYFHAAKSDQLLFDTAVEIIGPRKAQGLIDIDINEIQQVLLKWVEEGKTAKTWCASTILRVAQGLLSTLRDFGVLQGAANKQIAPAYLPVEAFSYIAFYLKQHQPSGSKLVELPDWKLFFLPTEGVERFLFEAHQHHLLDYHAAGSVTRLTFPAKSLEEYANVLAQRAH